MSTTLCVFLIPTVRVSATFLNRRAETSFAEVHSAVLGNEIRKKYYPWVVETMAVCKISHSAIDHINKTGVNLLFEINGVSSKRNLVENMFDCSQLWIIQATARWFAIFFSLEQIVWLKSDVKRIRSSRASETARTFPRETKIPFSQFVSFIPVIFDHTRFSENWTYSTLITVHVVISDYQKIVWLIIVVVEMNKMMQTDWTLNSYYEFRG